MELRGDPLNQEAQKQVETSAGLVHLVKLSDIPRHLL
jgi:hypothetical protein